MLFSLYDLTASVAKNAIYRYSMLQIKYAQALHTVKATNSKRSLTLSPTAKVQMISCKSNGKVRAIVKGDISSLGKPLSLCSLPKRKLSAEYRYAPMETIVFQIKVKKTLDIRKQRQ